MRAVVLLRMQPDVAASRLPQKSVVLHVVPPRKDMESVLFEGAEGHRGRLFRLLFEGRQKPRRAQFLLDLRQIEHVFGAGEGGEHAVRVVEVGKRLLLLRSHRRQRALLFVVLFVVLLRVLRGCERPVQRYLHGRGAFVVIVDELAPVHALAQLIDVRRDQLAEDAVFLHVRAVALPLEQEGELLFLLFAAGGEQAFQLAPLFGKIALGFPLGVISVLRLVHAFAPLAAGIAHEKVLRLAACAQQCGRRLVGKNEIVYPFCSRGGIFAERFALSAEHLFGDLAAGGQRQSRKVGKEEFR